MDSIQMGRMTLEVRPRLLHVDDDPAFRDLFAILFSRWFDITAAAEPGAALEALKHAVFDGVVLDYDLPGMTGLELFEQVREGFPALPVFFYTGQGSEDVAREAFQLGASDYFVKSLGTVGHTDSVANSIQKGLEARRLEERLRQHREDVEALVEERSRELVAANEALAREIEERKRVEAELRRQTALADSFFLRNPYSVQFYNPQGRVVRYNEASRALFQQEIPMDIDMLDIAISMYPELGPMFDRVRQGETVHMPAILANPTHFDPKCENRTVYAGAVVFPLMNEHGECEYIVMMHEDVTDRVLTEQALERALRELRRERGDDDAAVAIVDEIVRRRKAEEQLLHSRGSYKILFEASNDAIFIRRARDGRLVECNGRALEMFGLRREEAEEFQLAEGTRPEPGGKTVSTQRVATRQGRSFWAEVTVKRVEMGGEDCLLTLVRDIDRRKRMELELQAKNRELQDAFYVVSHDLKNPLYGAQVQVRQIRQERAELEGVCLELEQQLAGMRAFIDDLMRLSVAGKVIDEGRRQAIDTAVFLRAILGTVDSSGAARLRIDGDLPALDGDPVKLEEVFRNLFENVLKHAGERPRIMVSFRDGELCVSDDGVGIAAEHLDRLFDAGFTRGRSGTGFGLAIVRKIVEAHGGSVRAESDGPGQGLRLLLRLPTAVHAGSGDGKLSSPARVTPAR